MDRSPSSPGSPRSLTEAEGRSSPSRGALRRLLTVYLPDEAVPEGAAPDAVAEAAYLARGLERASLVAREEGADPGQLPPVPDGLDEASRLLLGVQRAMRVW